MGSEPPMRFLFVLVGPRNGPTNLMEVGESLAALTVDEEMTESFFGSLCKGFQTSNGEKRES